MKKKYPWCLKYQYIHGHAINAQNVTKKKKKLGVIHKRSIRLCTPPAGRHPSSNLHLSSLYTSQKAMKWLHCLRMSCLVAVW